MASTSPYQNNDYQASSTFRPYKLPINDIFKGISAQNEFWNIGARRVKSVYDDALNLKLTNAENRQIRDDYMREAEKQLTKLSSMDLSDPSVQRQGLGLFKPLFKDEGIMSDDQATRHIEKVNADALSYRQKENGKFYSATNHKYALMGADEFANSSDRMAGKEYLAKRKEYEPFYDPTQEINGILKNCKPNKGAGDQVQGYYIKSFSEESLSAEKINSCLDAGMSDRARRQLEINGTVTYAKNPEALRDKYLPHLQGTRSALSERKAAIQGILANKDNLKNLKPDALKKLGITDPSIITPAFIQSLQEQASSIDERISNINNTVTKLSRNDFSPIMGDNLEQVAGTVYSRDYMQNVGEGFAYDFATNSMKADPVQMMFFREAQQNARQEDDQEFDRDTQTKLFEQQLKLKMFEKGTIPKDLSTADWDAARVQNSTNNPFSSIDEGSSYDNVVQELNRINAQSNEVMAYRNRDMIKYGMPSEYKPGSTEEANWIENFRISAKDPIKVQTLDEYDEKLDNLHAIRSVHQGTIDIVDQEIAKDTKIREEQLKVKRVPYEGDPRGLQNMGAAMTDIGLKGPTNGQAPNAVLQWGNAADYGYGEVLKKRNELMKRETALQREGYLFPDLNDKKNPVKLQIAQEAGITESYIDKIALGQTDGAGRVIVTVAPGKKTETDYDQESVLQKLTRMGGNVNVRINSATGKPDPNGDAVVVSGIKQLKVIDENNLSSVMTPYMRVLESKAKANPNTSASTAYIKSKNGRDYRLDVTKSYDGSFKYNIIDKSTPNDPVYQNSDRQSVLNTFMTLIEKKQAQVNTR